MRDIAHTTQGPRDVIWLRCVLAKQQAWSSKANAELSKEWTFRRSNCQQQQKGKSINKMTFSFSAAFFVCFSCNICCKQSEQNDKTLCRCRDTSIKLQTVRRDEICMYVGREHDMTPGCQWDYVALIVRCQSRPAVAGSGKRHIRCVLRAAGNTHTHTQAKGLKLKSMPAEGTTADR